MVHYLEVILPLSVATPYTYAVDDAVMSRPMPGARVLVPLGKHKIYTGVVWQYVAKAPEGVELKMLIAVLDDRPILNAQQLHLWTWMADYYMSALGDVYRAAVPSALKLESETRFMIHSAFVASEPLPESLQSVLDVMRDGQFYTAAELARMKGVRQVMSQLNRLVLLGAVLTQESVEDMYKPRMKTVVSLSEAWRQESKLQELLDQFGRRAPRRQETLLQFLQLWQSSRGTVDKQELLSREQVSSSAYNALVSQGVLEQQQVQVDRLQPQQPTRASYPLNSYQQQAVNQILESWKQKPIVLLHGVTSSGKTELYIHLIEQQLRQGKQVLYLVPEIALTTQLTNRLATVFGPKLGVYHSRFSDAERVEIYQNLLHQKSYQLILGVRSSVFLPFSNLGLVIVDEEHEASYKQQDPAPRYHARNVALVLAHLHNAKTLLGTATPSISSYYHAVNGRYGLVKLMHRYKDISLPEISLLDLRESRRKRLMTEHFSDRLVDLMRAALNRHEQIILFQNRRGFAPYMTCTDCGWIPRCPHCDVSLTSHHRFASLVCHYCGYAIQMPQVCPQCGGNHLEDCGLGTERIEEEIRHVFPEARVARMDLDTTRTKLAYQRIIGDFEQHRIDILVGTQMVTKGLDFAGVSLVGVLNADHLLNMPDFRAFERAYQMLEQVSGRAGRKSGQGMVVIQTSAPEHEVLSCVCRHDYESMYQAQIEERQMFHYPPFFRLVCLSLMHRDSRLLEHAAQLLDKDLIRLFAWRCSPVVTPVVSRVRNRYVRQILLRIEQEGNFAQARQLIGQSVRWLSAMSAYKNVEIHVDVDPY